MLPCATLVRVLHTQSPLCIDAGHHGRGGCKICRQRQLTGGHRRQLCPCCFCFLLRSLCSNCLHSADVVRHMRCTIIHTSDLFEQQPQMRAHCHCDCLRTPPHSCMAFAFTSSRSYICRHRRVHFICVCCACAAMALERAATRAAPPPPLLGAAAPAVFPPAARRRRQGLQTRRSTSRCRRCQ